MQTEVRSDPVVWIRKRSILLQKFDIRKIRKAMGCAFLDTQPESIPDLDALSQLVVSSIGVEDSGVVDIEEVQNTIENVLMDGGYNDTARSYIRYRQTREQARKERLTPDNLAMADYIHAAKYARYEKTERRRETYVETVLRVRQMYLDRFPELTEEIKVAFELVVDRHVLPSMRTMQFAGRPASQHNARVYNCTFTLIDRARAFQEIFYLLLCGCGAGFSVQWRHVNKLPEMAKINTKKVKHSRIEDSIEGWGDALGELIQSHIEGYWIEFDYSGVRAEGAPISSGGKAPGHVPLRKCLERVRKILAGAGGRKLRPIECHDIICLTADAVLAGGIRRSSLISLFSADDGEMMRAKAPENFRPSTGSNDPGVNDQRQMANNSCVFLRRKITRRPFMRLMKLSQQSYGDPGFYFSDHPDYGCNPCGEVGLNPTIERREFTAISGEDTSGLDQDEMLTGFSFCNLCEINMAKVKDEAMFITAAEQAAFIGTLQATFNSFPYLGKVSEAIQKREALLGVSMTGMADNPSIAFDPELQRKAAAAAIAENKRVAKIIGIRPAARVTTIKPSGTASVALGVVGSGVHPHHARRYFRRITANTMEPPAIHFRNKNPHMVEMKPNGDWSIVFPIQAPENAVTVKEEPALDFLERVFSTYENWVKPGTADPKASPGLTHNVSCTVTVRDGEMDAVIDEVWNNRHRVAAMTFVPMTLDKLFPFAPREEVMTGEDEVKWNRLISGYRKVEWGAMREGADTTNPQAEIACGGAGGSCDIM